MSSEDFRNILKFWFGNNEEYDEYKEFWFDCSKDSYIIEKYTKILNELERYNIEDIEDDNDTILAMIIIFDQFSRSIYRNDDNKNFKIFKNDKKALYLSSLLINRSYDRTISLSKRVFILMPYRHQKNSDLLDFVLKKIEEYKKDLGDSSLLNRFRNATLSSYTNLTDRIYLSDFFLFSDIVDEYKEIIDEKCHGYIENIKNIKDIKTNCLYKTLNSFINSNGINSIGISLSGGVDSMVILSILSILSKIKDIKVYAMHIEYCNRDESVMETELIKKYCGKLDVPLYIRKVNYMKRNSVDRKFYEEETRKIRFSTYRYLSEKHSISGWCLGHHKDDLSENIIMNICNGRNLLDLKVMKKECVIDGVGLYRPFLDHPKSDIYDFAHSNCIPYLKDTTPDWSARGVLRRKVLPAMKDQWLMIDKNLLEIGKQSEELDYVFKNFVLEPLKNGIVMNEERSIVVVDLSAIYNKTLPMTVWLNLFLYIFHGMGIHMTSHKNLAHFVDSFSRNYDKKNQFIFSNGCVGFFTEKQLKIIKF